MKHIKVFESFGMGMEPNEKTLVEISIKGENPDAEYGCVANGVGNTPREAAMFALQVACDWLLNGDDSVTVDDLDGFENSPVMEYFENEAELEEALQMLEMGKIKKESPTGYSIFSSHGDEIYTESYVRPIPDSAAPIGGSILSSYSEEY
jgi:hypothetical protein